MLYSILWREMVSYELIKLMNSLCEFIIAHTFRYTKLRTLSLLTHYICEVKAECLLVAATQHTKPYLLCVC